MAESTSVALVYDDPKSGSEVLSTLRAEPEIVAAALYDIHGQVVASHPTNAAPAEFPARPTADGAHFETARLNLFLPVMEGSRRVGTLFLRQNLDGMYDRLYAYGLLLLVVLIGAGVLAFLISSVFQRSISEPILALAEAARTVSEKEDYSVRAVPGGKDELGFLTAAFNSMLSQIQSSRAVLQESEERFRLIADNIAQFAWMSDSDGKTLWINRRYTEYTGLTLDDVRAGRGMQLLHPDHAERTIRKFRECVRTGEAWEDTFQFRGLDGNYRWFLSRAIPIRDADGKVLRWFGTNTDVTGQREAEAALHASEQQLRLVTDNAQVFIVQIDREYRYRFVNRPYAARFGVTVDAILGRTIPEVVGAQAFESFRHHVDAALSGERVVFETEIPYASLGTRWMHVIYEPERNAEGMVIGLVGVSTDITARKNIEHEVARARDEALAASRAKDNFLATLSHELRTPLNPALLLASERARDAELPPRVRADFTTIRNCVELEAHLIDDLLDHSRISHGKISIEARPIDGEPLRGALDGGGRRGASPAGVLERVEERREVHPGARPHLRHHPRCRRRVGNRGERYGNGHDHRGTGAGVHRLLAGGSCEKRRLASVWRPGPGAGDLANARGAASGVHPRGKRRPRPGFDHPDPPASARSEGGGRDTGSRRRSVPSRSRRGHDAGAAQDPARGRPRGDAPCVGGPASSPRLRGRRRVHGGGSPRPGYDP